MMTTTTSRRIFVGGLRRRLSSSSEKAVGNVAIDRSGLGRIGYSELSEELKRYKEAETPLGKELINQIKGRGPISLHEYMRKCLLHPTYGYYARPGAERVIGMEGDFITAPELSRVFGDLVGVWLVSEWVAMGKPREVHVVEIGPGRGTLMDDILRATKNWPEFRNAARIEMIEASSSMRIAQQKTLRAEPLDERVWTVPNNTAVRSFEETRVRWHDSLDELDELSSPTLFVAQELLDAMPTHQFVRTPMGWREKLVDVDDQMESKEYFRMVIAPTHTPASMMLSKAPTLAKFEGGKDGDGDANDDDDKKCAEVSPSALAVVGDVARRVAKTGGAGLFIDYGKTTCLGDSLRAFKRHKQVSALSEPGLVDLTVDTDFAACSRLAALVEGVGVYGPVDQGEWLGRMGLEVRLTKLLENENITEKQADDIIAACERLVDPEQMGTRYKVLTLADNKTHQVPPAGFLPEEHVKPPPDDNSVIAP